MDLTQYESSDYLIEKQIPKNVDGIYKQKVYVYKGGGHPIDQGEITLTEEEAKALLPNKQPIKKIDRRILINNLMKEGFFNLFDELSKYLKDYPLLVEYTADKVLTQEELQALLGLLTFHKEGEVISQGLYDYLIQELKG